MNEKEILEDKKKKEEYVKSFGKIFETENFKIDTSKLPLLKYIVQEFAEEIYTPSEEHERLNRKKIAQFEKLERTFTEEQKENFFKYCALESEMYEEIQEQLFMFGFIMAKEIENELNYIKNTKLLK